ncbi:MAG: hypothetical protein JWL83_4317, partial [Actinomycetia bacterium]|nr:hypothetical protein [Actinomycetes bacterium]
ERWTVDTAEDLARVRAMCARLGTENSFGWRDLLDVLPPGTSGTSGTSRASGALALRPAYTCDAAFVLECRNDETAVRYSGSLRAVGLDEHKQWFEARMRAPGTPMWIGEVDDRRVGNVRVDVRTGVGEIGIAVHPQARGQGFGRALLEALLAELQSDQQVVDLVARVHVDNTASLRAFRGVGFVGDGVDGLFLVLRRDPRVPMGKA